jgi:hypothetical protein
MANDLIKKEVTRRVTSFWDKPEGTTGMIVGLGMLGGIGWAAYKIMPYVADLMKNTFYAALFVVLTAALAYVVLEGSMRRALLLKYQLLMEALTYSIIKKDPAGTLRVTQKLARKRLEKIESARTEVGGQVQELKQTLDGFKKEADQYLDEAKHLQTHNGSQADIEDRALKLQTLNEAYAELQPEYMVTNAWYDKLTEARANLVRIDENTAFRIKIATIKFNATHKGRSAWRLVKAAFVGSEEIEGLQNTAFDIMAEDYSNSIGEIDALMQDSQQFLSAGALKTAVRTDKGMKLLEELSKRNLSIVQPVEPELLPATGNSQSTGYAGYLKKK